MEGQAGQVGGRTVEPGWYRDPHDDTRLRKWDGQRWTDSWMVAPRSPATAATPPTSGWAPRATTAGWYADPFPGGGVRQRWWDGQTWTPRLRHGRTYPGRPSLGRWFFVVAGALRGLLLGCAVSAAVGLGMALWTLSLSDQALNGAGYGEAEANAYDTLDVIVSVAGGLVFLATIPVFITWLWAAYRNDRVDPTRLTHGSGWTVGAWFVPFLNLVRPYRLVADLRQGVRSGLGDERPDPYPRSVAWWWAAWIVMNLTSSVSTWAYRALDEAGDDLAWLRAWQVTGWTVAVESVAAAAGAYLAYTLVTRITAGLRRPEYPDTSGDGVPSNGGSVGEAAAR